MWRGGGILVHKHFQIIVKGDSSSLPVLNKKIKGVLGMGCESSHMSRYFLREVEG